MDAPSNSRLYIDCPQCGFPLTIVAKRAGQTVTCDNCLHEFWPASQAAPPTAPKKHRQAGSTKRVPEAEATNNKNSSIEDDLFGDDYVENKQTVLKEDYEFTVQCPICGTRQEVTDKAVGKKVKCYDCHTRYKIREPSARRRRPRGSRRRPSDELRLKPLADSSDASADHRPQPMLPDKLPDSSNTFSTPGETALRKAEEELKKADVPPPLPTRPLIDGIAGFLFEPTVLIRSIFLAVALQIELTTIAGAVARASVPNAMSNFASLAMTVFSIFFGIFVVLAVSVTGLTLLRESASGKLRLESWPGFDPTDWFVESFYVVASLTASLVLGGIIGRLFAIAGPSVYAVGLATACGVSLVLAFPPFLLSALEAGSPIQFLSRPIWQGLLHSIGSWFRFTTLWGLTAAGAAMLVWQLVRFENTATNFLAALIAVSAALIFFCLLGRLARVAHDAYVEPVVETE